MSASTNTFTPSLALLVGPERLPSRDVSTLVGTTAPSFGHTLASAQNKAGVTGAGLHTGASAFGRSFGVRTSGRTGISTEFIVAVGWTFSSFREMKDENRVRMYIHLTIN